MDEICRLLEPFKGISERADQEISSRRTHYRMAEIACRIPLARSEDDIIVDIGATAFWIPIYKELLGYRKVTILCRPWGSFFEIFESRGLFEGVDLRIVECDAERSTYPLPDGHAACVVCFDLLEHLAGDPMRIFLESNRMLAPSGNLVIGTPNVSHFGNLWRVIQGGHPFTWSSFTESYADRHNREYTPGEIRKMLENSGFRTFRIETHRNDPAENPSTLTRLVYSLARLRFNDALPIELLYSNILATGTKTGEVTERYPSFLYEIRGKTSVDFTKLALPENIGVDGSGRTVILVRTAPVEVSTGTLPPFIIFSLSCEPIDILVDLFVQGEWRAGQKVVGAMGAVESRMEIDVKGDFPKQAKAYFSVKTVPSGETWRDCTIDIKLPYLRIKESEGKAPAPESKASASAQ
jgi:SAM-dependent methyltransferase